MQMHTFHMMKARLFSCKFSISGPNTNIQKHLVHHPRYFTLHHMPRVATDLLPTSCMRVCSPPEGVSLGSTID